MNNKQIRKSLSRAISDITPDIKDNILLNCEQREETTAPVANVWKQIMLDREQHEEIQEIQQPEVILAEAEEVQETPQPEVLLTETDEVQETPQPLAIIPEPQETHLQIIDQKWKDVRLKAAVLWQRIVDLLKAFFLRFAEKVKRIRISKRQLTVVAAAAAVIVVVIAIPMNRPIELVDSVIIIDANPSVEICTGSSEKILSITPLNSEASILVEDIDIENTSLDTAVDTLIEAMLERGFISEKKNALLITVENADAQKSQELQERLTGEISSILKINSLDGAIIGQKVNEDENLRALADEHSISIGKAALVKLLTEQNTGLKFADIAKLDINEICLLLSSGQMDLKGISVSGKANSSAYISEDQAKSNSFVHAGVLGGSVASVKIGMDYAGGHMIYNVSFRTADAEYEYKIDAVSGTILSSKKENKETISENQTPQHAPPTHADSYISVDEAKESALFHAGLDPATVTFIRTYLNVADGNAVFDIEFVVGEYEFDYVIDAYSSIVLTYDHDIENYPVPIELPKPEVDNHIGKTQAKVIALTHAGFEEKDVNRLRAELRHKHDRVVYEVEFRNNRQRYEYIIDATTGEILEWE